MKKITWIIIGIVGGLIIIASAFSAGAIVGNILLPKPDPSWFSQSTQIVPSQAAVDTPTVDPSVNPQQLIPPSISRLRNCLFLFGRPGKSFMINTLTNRLTIPH